MSERILRRPEVEDQTGLSRSTIYTMMTAGEFPKPIRIGRRAVGWPEGWICDWVDARKAKIIRT